MTDSDFEAARRAFITWALTSRWHQHEFHAESGVDIDANPSEENLIKYSAWLRKFCWPHLVSQPAPQGNPGMNPEKHDQHDHIGIVDFDFTDRIPAVGL